MRPAARAKHQHQARERKLDQRRQREEAAGDGHLLEHLALHDPPKQLACAQVANLIGVQAKRREQQPALQQGTGPHRQ